MTQLLLPMETPWTPKSAAAFVGREWCRPDPPLEPEGCDQGIFFRALWAAEDAGLVESRKCNLVTNCHTGDEHIVYGELPTRGRGAYHIGGMRCTCRPDSGRCTGASWREWRVTATEIGDRPYYEQPSAG